MQLKSFMQKATEIYLILLASVHLLYIGFSGYSHIFEAKQTTFCIISILYITASVIALFKYFLQCSKDIKSSLKRKILPAHIFAVFYLTATVISGFISSYFPYTFFGVSRFEGVFSISLYIACFFIISLFPCSKKYILIIFSVCVTLFSLLCIIQLFGYNPLSLYPEGTGFYDAGIKYTTAFIGTIGNTNLVGAFICLVLPFMTVILLKTGGYSRFFLLIPISLLTFTVLKMGVDSALIGLLAGIITGIPLVFGFKRKTVIIYILVLIILFALSLFFIYYHPAESGFIYEISEILHGRISDTFGSGRIRIWKNVLSEISDSPIFGKGPDTMQLEKFPSFERYYPDLGKVMKTGIDVAHNELLNILYHQGILGLSAYFGFIISILSAWFKNRRNTVVLAFGISFICYLTQSLFTFSMCLTAPYFWLCAGMVVGISGNSAESPSLQ